MNVKIRRIAHRLFFAALAVITLLVLFYAEENWRGARALAAVRRDLQARGEPLDPEAFIPPPVPDDQNLAMIPLFVRAYRYRVDPTTRLLTFGSNEDFLNSAYDELTQMPFGSRRIDPPPPIRHGNWTTAHRVDLAQWQQYYGKRKGFPHASRPQTPADDVLLALSRYAPLLDELTQAAADRPSMRFPVNWMQRPFWSIRLPHYNSVQALTATLRLRASAELTLGQTAPALRDVELMLRLRQATKNDPILIAALVDNTVIYALLQPVWEGLAARQWSAVDLDRLRDGLRDINALRNCQQAMRGERAFSFNRLVDDILQDKIHVDEVAGSASQMAGIGPRGWYAQNAAVSSRYLQDYLIDPIDPASRRVDSARIKSFAPAMERLPTTPSTFLAKMGLTMLDGIILKFARAQTAVDQAVAACALEKYHLDRHAYPAALEALVPAYLDRVPTDMIDGAPMRYRLTADGRYQLYSIGWDRQDGGGVIEWPDDREWRQAASGTAEGQKQRFPNPSSDRGDWVWQYAPAEPPDPPANQSRLESLP